MSARWAFSIVLCSASLGACTALAPKSPVKADAVCGYTQDSIGRRIPDIDLQLVREDQTVVAEAHTDASGNFNFPPVTKGTYYLTMKTRGWQLGWPVEVTASTSHRDCSDPLTVTPSLACGGSVSKKGYHPKY